MAASRSLPTEGPSAGGAEFDDLDDLFDYDVRDENDPFNDNYKLPNKTGPAKGIATKTNAIDTGLGIDEEVEVSKKIRVPRVKLDEHRLLSAAGIPKLRRKAKDLKFKGKGHEYSDAARLLAFYQLWLDDLFPKARFLDALAMVEKAGHKRQLQTMRMEWINEGRPKSSVREDSIFDEQSLPPKEGDEREKAAPAIAPIFEKAVTGRESTPGPESHTEMGIDELYDATPRAPRRDQNPADSQDSLFGGRNNEPGPGSSMGGNEVPHEDDLDALLAEEDMMQEAPNVGLVSTASKQPTSHDDAFEDDMEAMAEMDGLW